MVESISSSISSIPSSSRTCKTSSARIAASSFFSCLRYVCARFSSASRVSGSEGPRMAVPVVRISSSRAAASE